MRGQVFKYWNRVRSGFWFLPTVMAGVAVALAFVSVAISEPVAEWFTLNFGWTFTGGAEGASAVLGIIGGSMITIAGVVFSMTLVALSLASSQLGPRLLRSFMRDTTTQVVLGTFISTFLYCLIVLRTIRRVEEDNVDRAKFMRQVYKQDIDNPLGYDLVVNLGTIALEPAVDLVVAALASKLTVAE